MVEGQEVVNQRIEVVGPRRIPDDIGDPSCREICLLAARFYQIAARPPWLIVDEPVSPRSLNLTQIGSREVVALLRKIAVGRIDFYRQDRFDIVAPL